MAVQELINSINERSAEISDRFTLANNGRLDYTLVDERNATDREEIHQSALGLASAVQAMLPVIADALSDALAYRTDSGEDAERYRALAAQLGITIS